MFQLALRPLRLHAIPAPTSVGTAASLSVATPRSNLSLVDFSPRLSPWHLHSHVYYHHFRPRPLFGPVWDTASRVNSRAGPLCSVVGGNKRRACRRRISAEIDIHHVLDCTTTTWNSITDTDNRTTVTSSSPLTPAGTPIDSSLLTRSRPSLLTTRPGTTFLALCLQICDS